MAAETKAHKKVKTPHGFPPFLYLIQSGVMLSRFLGLIECSYLGAWFRQVLAVKMQSEKS